MTWEDARTQYPAQWIIVEALHWQDEGDRRQLLDLSVVQHGCDERTVLQESNRWLADRPERQFYPVHTSTTTLLIKTPLPLVTRVQHHDRHAPTFRTTRTAYPS